MSIDNGRQLSTRPTTTSEDSEVDLTELESEKLEDITFTENDEERVDRVLEYEKQIQFAEKETPPKPSSISFRDAVWNALEEKNLTARTTTGRISKVDVREDALWLTYIVDGETYTTDIPLNSKQYARLLEYCGVSASALQSLTGKQVPIQDTSTGEDYPLMLPRNQSSVANRIYSFSRLLYKYRITDVMSDEDENEEETTETNDEDTESNNTGSISQTLGIPVHIKFLLLYVVGLVLLCVSFPFAPFEFEILNGFIALLVLFDVIFSIVWGIIALFFAGVVIQSINKNYLPI